MVKCIFITAVIIIIITMAQQPYMGPGLLLPPLFEVTGS
jgi:membrane protein CcdC involved in cytochrome C biogenesis